MKTVALFILFTFTLLTACKQGEKKAASEKKASGISYEDSMRVLTYKAFAIQSDSMFETTFKLNYLDTSIYYYSKILDLDSTNLLALINRGRAYIWKQDLEKGFSDLDKAVEKYPVATAYSIRGMAYIRARDLDKAYLDLTVADRLKPNSASTLYGLSLLMAEKGMYDSAQLLCNRADTIKFDPLYSEDIRFRILSRQNHYKEAIQALDRLIKVNPGYGVNYNNRAYMKNKLKDFKGALKDCNQAIEFDSSMAFAYNNRAYALLHLNQTAVAMKDVQRSLELDNTNVYAYRNRAEIYIKMKETEKGCMDLNTASGMNPDPNLAKEIESLKNKSCK